MTVEFTVDHNDTVANDNGIEQLIGWVTATVETKPGNYRVRDLGGPTPRALKMLPRKGYLAADGHMYADETLAGPFRLVANDPAFNLRELTYRFDFDLTTLPGVPVSIPFCRGPAPGSDTTLQLARLMNDLDQPVVEVRTKGYAEDILDANAIGIALVTAADAAAVRLAADAPRNLIPTIVKTTAYTAAAGDLVPVDATSAGVTVTLPTAPADKTLVAVKKIDASANVVTVARGGTDTFNKSGGSTSLTLSVPFQAITLQYSVGIWYVISGDLPSTALTVDGARTDTYDLDPAPLTASDVGAYARAEVDDAINAAQNGPQLVTPSIDSIKDSNRNAILDFSTQANAVNRLGITNAPAGLSPSWYATGPDVNISALVRPKGTGRFTVYVATGQTPTISGSGDDPNHNFNLASKGTGTVQANGFDITTTSVVSVTGTVTLDAVPNRHYIALLGSGAVPTLPTAVGNTSLYHLKNVHTASIAVAVTSSQTIDGGTGSLTILPKQCFTLVSDGSNWVII